MNNANFAPIQFAGGDGQPHSTAKFYKAVLFLTLTLTLSGALPAVAATFIVGTTNPVEGPGAGADSVVLAAGDTWTAAADAAWLQISAGSQSGTGNTNVVFTFDQNTGATRTGTLTLAGQTVTVTQAGAAYALTHDLATIISPNITNLSPVTASANATWLFTNGVQPFLNQPTDVAVDPAGNVYALNFGNADVLEWSPASSTVSVPFGTPDPLASVYYLYGLALDSTNNLYVADDHTTAVYQFNAATTNLSSVMSSLISPAGVKVDGAGNVYAADAGSGIVKEWSGGTVATLVSGLMAPWGLALDAATNVYITDEASNMVFELSGGTLTTLVSSNQGLTMPRGVGVDGGGNVYILDVGHAAVKEWVAASNTLVTLIPASDGLAAYFGMTVDAAGNVYVADCGNNAIKELPRALVDPSGRAEGYAAGSDVLPPTLPASANLNGVFAPASDSPWLTITGVTNGVVNFSYTATATNRTGHINLLGMSIPIAQQPFLFTNNNGVITLTGYTGADGNVSLPGTINGEPVTAIGTNAFAGNTNLTSVTIPGSVTNVGEGAFADCPNLHLAYFQGHAPRVAGTDGSTDSSVFFGEPGTVFYLPGAPGWGSAFGGWPTAAGLYQPQPQILGSSVGWSAPGNDFQFTLFWATNTAVVVEASTNLQNWWPVVTNTLVNGTNAFADFTWTNYPQRFYRVRTQ